MNIGCVKEGCLSSCLHRRHSSTPAVLLCALFNARHYSCEHSSTLAHCSCEHSPTLAITAVFTLHRSHLAGVAHPARHRCRLIRHLILPCKPPTRCCTARLRCSVLLPVELYARGRHRRLQIGHSLAVSLLSLSLITLSNHSSLLVHLCLHSLRHSLFLLSTHSDTLCYSPQTVFTTTHKSPWLPTGVFFLVSSFPYWHALLPLLS